MVKRISDMEPSQRPRERLLEWGPQSLKEAELLAVLLRTGRTGEGALVAAEKLLADSGGLAGMARMDYEELVKRPGVGPAKAATLLAALELAKRLARTEMQRAQRLNEPQVAGEYLVQLLGAETAEIFGFLSLDNHHRLIRDRRLTIGTRDQAPVDPAELFRRAVLDRAAGVLLYHNHPSGDAAPSADDLALTRRVASAGRSLGITVHDHLIVADRQWVSLRAHRPDLFSAASPD